MKNVRSGNNFKKWNKEDDATLLSLKEKGVPSSVLATLLGRTVPAVDTRCSFLRKTNATAVKEEENPITRLKEVEEDITKLIREEVQQIAAKEPKVVWKENAPEGPMIMVVVLGAHAWELFPGMSISGPDFQVKYDPANANNVW